MAGNRRCSRDLTRIESAKLSATLDLLRHGEVAGGMACFRGRQDDPLTAQGWQQMTRRLERFAPTTGWTQIISSPARRCAEFAAELSTTQSCPLMVEQALSERDFGAWEGQAVAAIAPADLANFWADPLGFTPAEAEPMAMFIQRVNSAWQQIVEQPPAHGLMITHGGVIRVILGAVLGIAAQRLTLIEVPPACFTRLRLPTAPGMLPTLVLHCPLDVE